MSGERDDDDYEEEEVLVLVEIAGIMDTQLIQKTENRCKILGVDTEEPILQIGNYILTGDYEDMIGTAVFFEEVESTSDQDPFDKSLPKMLKYLCKTNKKLVMKRAFVREQGKSDDNVKENSSDEKMDSAPI